MTYTMKRWSLKAIVALSIGLGAWTSGEAQSLTWLGTLGGRDSIGRDVSLNGVVVGIARNAQGTERAFRWTPSAGMVDILSSVSGTARAFAVSANGKVVVGEVWLISDRPYAFRWTLGGGQETVWRTNNSDSIAYACSYEGSMVAGEAHMIVDDDDSRIWRLGTPGSAFMVIYGMSPDGSTFVGNYGSQAVYHRNVASHRPVGIARINIPRLSGDAANYAYDASLNGEAIVGVSENSQQLRRAYAFFPRSNTLQELGGLSTMGNSEAFAVTADGLVVVGYSTDSLGRRRAVRWRNGQVQDLNVVFASLLPSNFTLNEARGVSLDGRYITGQGYNAQTGRFEAFLLDTQGEGGCNPPNPADVNNDGSVDDADLLETLFNFGWQRCPNQGAQSFVWLGTLGGAASIGFDVSLNGVVAGVSKNAFDRERAFRWTQAAGMVDIVDTASATTRAYAISSNGEVIVGERFFDGAIASQAYRWTLNAGVEEVWTVGVGEAVAFACSGDGEVAGGVSIHPVLPWGVVWRSGTLTDRLPFVYGMSPDGTVFAMRDRSHRAGYMVGERSSTRHTIPRLPGGNRNYAHDAAIQGLAIVGSAMDGQERMRAYIFYRQSNQLVDLGALEGGHSEAYAITSDWLLNPTIVGYSVSRSGERRAVRWRRGDAGWQVQDLNNVFANLLSPGSLLIEARGLSLDGRYITGLGYNGETNRFEAFLLDTQGEGGCNPPNPADVNGDGSVDDADLLEVLFNFGWQRCP